MRNEIVLLFAEDNPGHFTLIKNYFVRMGVRNCMHWFKNGQEILDFLFNSNGSPKQHDGLDLVLFLDINMPRIDGIEVLKRIRNSQKLKDMHVIMLTTSDSQDEVDLCYDLGCSAYIVKPLKYSCYIKAMRKIGLFPSLVADGFKLTSKHSA